VVGGLLAVGLILSVFFSRGTRWLDVGVAMSTGLLIGRIRYGKEILVVLAVFGLLITGHGMFQTRYMSEKDVEAAKWLNRHNAVVLAGWERGMMIEALSDAKAVSSVAGIKHEYHQMLVEDTPLEEFKAHNITYVMVDRQDFTVEDGNRQIVKGGLILSPCRTNKCLIYKLRHKMMYHPVYDNGEVMIYHTGLSTGRLQPPQ
jgi:hypothetical protein